MFSFEICELCGGTLYGVDIKTINKRIIFCQIKKCCFLKASFFIRCMPGFKNKIIKIISQNLRFIYLHFQFFKHNHNKLKIK